MGVYTSYKGNNADLIAVVARLYLQNGFTIADVTYGKGVFWNKINLSKYNFFPSDIISCPNSPYDFKDLPYKDATFDVVVFDPPYTHNPGNLIVDKNYQNASTTKGFYHLDIMEMYKEGMQEGFRILKTNGTMWIKCKDEVESSIQRWGHVEIYEMALEIGLYAKDLFILTQSSKPIIQHKNQKHARKNHSFLWIFQKTTDTKKREIIRCSKNRMKITAINKEHTS